MPIGFGYGDRLMDLTWAAVLVILCLASWVAARHKPPPCPPWVVRSVLWLAIFAVVLFVWELGKKNCT